MKKLARGFTLVELLVVIAIIGVLVALLLPAVQAAREASRRSQCINNLKQLGVAMQNYHDTYKKLPAGSHSCCWGTWQVDILPFIEQRQLAAMYKKQPETDEFFGNQYRYDAPGNLDVVKARIAALTCPSDEPQVNPENDITFHNYVANYGNTNHIGTDYLGPANPAYIKYLGSPFVGDDQNVKFKRTVAFREITDGLSNTLLASETVQGRDGDQRGNIWWGWSAGFETFASPNGSDPDLLQQAKYCVQDNELNPPCDGETTATLFRASARSRHTGGVNVAFCDGSVRFVVDDVDLAAWRAASTTQGEEVFAGLTP